MKRPAKNETRHRLVLCRFVLVVVAMPILLSGQTITMQSLPEGEGKSLMAVACTQCHGMTPILEVRDGRAGWTNTVEEMVLRGAHLNPAEAETVVNYLLENLGPASGAFRMDRIPHDSAISGNPVDAASVTLPDAPGKDVVETRCTMCHDVGRVVTVRRNREDWERITRNMIERGPRARPEQVEAILSYLTSQFGF